MSIHDDHHPDEHGHWDVEQTRELLGADQSVHVGKHPTDSLGLRALPAMVAAAKARHPDWPKPGSTYSGISLDDPDVAEAYRIACLIEKCGASVELTTASSAAFDFVQRLGKRLMPPPAPRADAGLPKDAQEWLDASANRHATAVRAHIAYLERRRSEAEAKLKRIEEAAAELHRIGIIAIQRLVFYSDEMPPAGKEEG